MLDDCKGEKFEELLAIFSTAVLRKTLSASSDPSLQTTAMRLSLASNLTRQEYELMLPLVLAHRVSLNQIGDRRNRTLNTHEKFTQLLDLKKHRLDERSKENLPQLPDSGANIDALSRDLKGNWLGSKEWADTLLHGGAQSSSDAFLDLPFDTAWAKANESSVGDLRTNTSPDLLVDLESRVLRQRARLQRWRQYSASMRRHERVESTSSSKPSPLAFREHQTLTVASISKAVRQPVERASLKADDRALLFSMTESLARINGRPARHHSRNDSKSRNTAPSLPSMSAGGSNRSSIVEEPTHPTNSTTTTRTPPQTPNQPSHHSQPPRLPRTSPSPDLQPDREPPSRFTLVERTRKSMSLIPPPTHTKPKESFRSHRPRPSYPVNQFETPQKQFLPTRSSTPRDELFEEEADYASVFKSRPRVAHSPVASPAVHISPIGDFNLNPDEDVDVDLDGLDGTSYVQETPSAWRRRVL
ncbi:hypothetical protein BO70DRAFT_364450 [Aspergillus heteromorphus CBS 117.55]|uniref:HAUS augmin-like complex subunit 6 N-terminal domain-containing protein n=1 Tax=Aspergillus heteromorphus CBS 117.55 TaxID=1448321 RepID=A0A317VNQ4_9EURO|nr:uncharacterized protein BO70DRAFT_364450 [Aspergillus heteromorphus CBS 117.55]PWY73560.1 hypothetical protein BO70DRAFT_364450 [Aspergillus heteromorphus CBS 117.55]